MLQCLWIYCKRMIVKSYKWLWALLWFSPFFLFAQQEDTQVEQEPVSIVIEEARSRVFFYAIFLKVENIVQKENQLVGNYNIRLPSRSKDDEQGTVLFVLEKPWQEIITKGGKIQGKGTSTNPKYPERIIVCEFRPDRRKEGSGRLRMTIDTKERILEFNTTYQDAVAR